MWLAKPKSFTIWSFIEKGQGNCSKITSSFFFLNMFSVTTTTYYKPIQQWPPPTISLLCKHQS
jgi:hypothetical protein